MYPYLLKGQQTLPNCKPITIERPGDARYTIPLPHPTTHLLHIYSPGDETVIAVHSFRTQKAQQE